MSDQIRPSKIGWLAVVGALFGALFLILRRVLNPTVAPPPATVPMSPLEREERKEEIVVEVARREEEILSMPKETILEKEVTPEQKEAVQEIVERTVDAAMEKAQANRRPRKKRVEQE